MSTPPKQEVIKHEERFTEFVPFGAQDKIKLSIAMVRNLIAVKTKKGHICSEADAIKFIAMCQARRLNPFEGDAFLVGYDTNDGPKFSLITAHQAFLKRAEVNKEYDGMKSGIIVERDGQILDLEGDFYLTGDKVMGGWATVFFKDRKQPMHKRIRMERFRKAFGVWLDDAAGMICKCAEADALRSSFPTMLGGLYLREEVQIQPEVRTSTPIFTPKPPQGLPEGSGDPQTPKDAPAPPSAQGEASWLVTVRSLCTRDGVKESDLVEFANAIGIASDEAKTLEDVDKTSERALPMILENWEEFSQRIKNTPTP